MRRSRSSLPLDATFITLVDSKNNYRDANRLDEGVYAARLDSLSKFASFAS